MIAHINNLVTTSLTEHELKQASALMLGLLRSIRDLMSEIREDAEYFLDPEDIVDEFDQTLLRIALTSEGLRFILDAHLNGTTNSGSRGLIARLARLPAKLPAKAKRPAKRSARNSTHK
jgi:hypothetical protein